MFDALSRLFNADSLSPHGICLLWRPELIWTHVVSDALIGLAYFSIPIALAAFVVRRHDVAFTWVFWAFALFILACGSTHFFAIWTLWVPDYGAEAVVKAVTAAASIATAAALWPLLPKALALPSPAQLAQANLALADGIAERDQALAALRRETTERERAEEMLRHSQKMEALGQLTGGIAHDFNNLLTVVLANLELIEKRLGEGAEPVLRSVRDARTGAERAAELTNQLLAFGRKQPLQTVEIAPNGLVSGVIALLGRTLGDGVVVESELSGSAWPVQADRAQLESALVNLAVNARDAMPKGGRLTFRTRNVPGAEVPDDGDLTRARDYLAIEVSDTGEGMSEETRAHAFEPFFTTKEIGRGSGLGLSQVHGFAKQSGGTVRIDSELGRGTSVTLYLPRALPPAR